MTKKKLKWSAKRNEQVKRIIKNSLGPIKAVHGTNQKRGIFTLPNGFVFTAKIDLDELDSDTNPADALLNEAASELKKKINNGVICKTEYVNEFLDEIEKKITKK